MGGNDQHTFYSLMYIQDSIRTWDPRTNWAAEVNSELRGEKGVRGRINGLKLLGQEGYSQGDRKKVFNK